MQSVEKCNVMGDALKDTKGGALVRVQCIDNKVFKRKCFLISTAHIANVGGGLPEAVCFY